MDDPILCIVDRYRRSSGPIGIPPRGRLNPERPVDQFISMVSR